MKAYGFRNFEKYRLLVIAACGETLCSPLESTTHLNLQLATHPPKNFGVDPEGVGWDGLEPSTNALKGRCSTIELPTRFDRKSTKRDALYRFTARRRQELSFRLS